MTKDDRYRNWVFTSYKIEGFKVPECMFCIYQEEECPTTKKRHLQGYIEFKDKLSMRSVKSLFEDHTLHLEVRQGSQAQAVAYCSKKDTRVKEPIIIGKLKNQGHRKDLDEIYDDISEGMTAKEILLRHKGNAVRHINVIKKSLMIYHDLDEVDKYILCKRNKETEMFNNEQMKTIIKNKKADAVGNEPNFEPYSYFDGQ